MPAPHLIPMNARRHAFFRLGATMCATDTGADHRPTRDTLVQATGLLPVDHPQLWTSADLVKSANRRHAARIAGEQWAQCSACSGTGHILGVRAYGACVTADGGPKRYPCPRCSDAR